MRIDCFVYQNNRKLVTIFELVFELVMKYLSKTVIITNESEIYDPIGRPSHSHSMLARY